MIPQFTYPLAQALAHSILLGWCKSNCGFALLNFALWYWNTLLNKWGYMSFNGHFSLSLSFFFLLMTYYLLDILYVF